MTVVCGTRHIWKGVITQEQVYVNMCRLAILRSSFDYCCRGRVLDQNTLALPANLYIVEREAAHRSGDAVSNTGAQHQLIRRVHLCCPASFWKDHRLPCVVIRARSYMYKFTTIVRPIVRSSDHLA